jgi:N12 class adenine-specific DNA methylase
VIFPPGDEGKIRANIQAIELVKRLTEENRNPTPAEKKTLTQYMGWGRFAQKIFSDEFDRYLQRDAASRPAPERYFFGPSLGTYKDWEKKYGRKLHPALGGALTAEEWDAARKSTLNAHYTSREVVEAMWGLVDRLGFKGGAVLEPSAGSGLFIGLMPDKLARRSQVNAVELDRITGQILTKLYPQARVQVTGFQDARGLGDNTQDLVISNFPFGKYSVFDPKRKQYEKWSIHNYFFGRSIDAVRPGGLVVAVTSHYTLDAVNSGEIRAALAEKADFVGAIRLPYTAFKKDAGTEVVTDILVFRKKDASSYGLAQEFRVTREVASGKDKAVVNQYFADHPEMVLGTHSTKGSMYSENEYTVEPKKEPAFGEQLKEAVGRFPEGILGEGKAAAAATGPVKYAERGDVDGTLIERDGQIYMVADGKLSAPTMIDSKGKEVPALSNASRRARAAGYLKIKTATRQLVERMAAADATEAELGRLRAALNRDYDAFVKAHGRIGDVANSFLRKIDIEFPTVDALEIEDVQIVAETVKSGRRKGEATQRRVKSYAKSDIFSRRTVFPFVEPSTADGIEDAVKLARIYRGSLDTDYIASLTGTSPEAARAELLARQIAFVDPANGLLTPAEEYLSGNVKKKLARAKAAAEEGPEYAGNIKALEAVQPDPLDIEFISFRLGSSWVPTEAVQDFVKATMGVETAIHFTRNDDMSRYHLTAGAGRGAVLNTQTWGVNGADGTALVEDSLNLKRTQVYYTDENKNRVKDVAASEAAQAKQQEIQDEFLRWARADGRWSQELARIYNEEKNGHVLRQDKDPEIDHFPGASRDIRLRPLQKRFVVRGLKESMIGSYGVGTGKTYSFISLAMEMRRIGTAKKPMIVVQGATIGQYRKAFNRLYPAARVLIPDENQRAARYRQRLLAQMSTGDWDAIVIPHSFFDGIADDPDRESAFIGEQIAMLEDAISEAEAEEGKGSYTVKDLEALKERKEVRLKKVLDRRKDKALPFEKMGIDALLVDEAHAYKRSEFFTKMSGVKGIDQGASQRSTSLYLKARYVQEKTGGKNVILATGTPISNTTAELWTIIRYVRPDLLEEYGVTLFDDFAATFGRTNISLEETESGTYKEVERFNRYVNGLELLTMWRTAADVQLTRAAGLKLPDIEGGKPTFVTVERTPSLNRFIDQIRDAREAWENLPGKEKRAQRHVPLVLFGLAKKAAVDMRLVSSAYEDHPDSKLNQVVGSIYKIWEETAESRATQVVFLDSYRDSTGGFNAYEDLRAKLIEKGVPASEVAVVTDAKGDAAREALFDRVRNGATRIIIGSTAKLGVGVNVQDKLIAAHHVDVPPRPMDIEQRNGRIVREGNEHPAVKILNYGVRATLDSVMYDRLVKKQRFIDQMLVGDIEGREFEDPFSEEQASLAEMMAAFSGNPLVFEKTDIDVKVKKLRRAELRHQHEVSLARSQAGNLENERIPKTERYLEEIKAQADEVTQRVPGGKLTRFSARQKDFDRKGFNEFLAGFETEAAKKYAPEMTLVEYLDFRDASERVTSLNFSSHGYEGRIALEAVYQHPEVAYLSGYSKPELIKKYGKDKVKFSGFNIALGYGRQGDKWMVQRNVGKLAGLVTSLENELERIVGKPADIATGIKKDRADLAELKKIATKTFAQAAELRAAEQRAREIEEELKKVTRVKEGGDSGGGGLAALLKEAGYKVGAEEGTAAEAAPETPAEEEAGPAEEAGGQAAEFYIKRDAGFVPVPGARAVAIVPWAETFVHKNVDGWTVTERTTGLAVIGDQVGRDIAIREAERKLTQAGEAAVKKMIANADKVPQLEGGTAEEYDLARGKRVAARDIPLADVLEVFPGQTIAQDEGGIWITMKGGWQAYVHAVEQITVDQAKVDAYFGTKMPEGTYEANGVYVRGRSIIRLARNRGTNAWVLRHESVHLLEDRGVLRPDDVEALRAHIVKEVAAGRWTPKNREDVGGKEDRANWVRQELKDREAHKGALRRILDTIAEIVDTFVNLFKVTARGVAREIESGRVYERPAANTVGIERGGQQQLFDDIAAGKPLPQAETDYDLAATVDEILPPGVAERYKAAKIARPKLLETIKEKAKLAAATFTPGRLFPKMPSRYFGRENVLLREFMESGDYAKSRAIMELKEILEPRSFGKGEYELFGLRLVLSDLAKDMEDGGPLADWEAIVDSEGELPFGFKSKAEVEQALMRADAEVARSPKVAAALARRENVLRDLREQLVAAKMLPAAVLTDNRYFHHQVLEYLNAKHAAGVGAADARVKKAGWQRARMGSIKDYNTSYLQSEFEVLAQGFDRLNKKRILDEIGQAADIVGGLKDQARRHNYVAIVGGERNFARLVELRSRKADLQAEGGLDAEQKQQLKAINDEIRELDPTMPFREKIARGMSELSREFGDEGMDEESLDFREIADLAAEGSMPARMILKAIGDRNKFIKDTLGRDFTTWRDLMRERAPRAGSKGWAEWVPRPGSAWYMTNSINDQILGQVLAGERQLAEGDVRKVLARGADVRWVVPAELAEVLDGKDFQGNQKDNVVSALAEGTMNKWKQWILINPMRIIKYNLNNMSGDLDIAFAYDPKIITRYSGKAMRDLWAYHYDKEMAPELKAELKEALRVGALGGISAHDIPDITKLHEFRMLEQAMGAGHGLALDLIERYWSGSKNFTSWRENVLRLAAYRYFKDRVRAGHRVYGASLPSKVDAIPAGETERKAGLLARELVGDYGGLSQGGRWLRKKLIPFYSWSEINAPRYWRMFRNLAVEGEPKNKRLAAFGLVAGKKGAMLTAKAFMLYGAIHLWNALVWPDEEEELGEAGRRQLHIILGRRPDGSIISLRLQGALSDALSWLGLEDFPEDARELASGKKSVGKFALEAAKAPVNKLVQGVRPDIKMPGELLTGRQLYPDVFNPRPIRDKGEHVARALSLEAFYRKAAGRPMKGGSTAGQVWEDILGTFTYSADPGEMAYYKARDLARTYLEDKGIDQPAHDPTDRSNALFYYKQAIKWGDAEAAERYLKKYKELGGNAKGLKISVQRAHPLASLPKRDLVKFLNRLDEQERETVKRATRWYKETYKQRRAGA